MIAELDEDIEVDNDDEPDPVPEGDCEVVLKPAEDDDTGRVPLVAEALAVAWKASKDLFTIGLTVKTMSDLQWPIWWQ